MRDRILAALSAGLVAFASGCTGGGEGDASTPGGSGDQGTTSGGPGPGGTTGTGTSAAACTVDARNLPVSDARGATPSIVWTGSAYAVAWHDLDLDQGDIHIALLDAGGAKLTHAVVADGPSVSSHPSVHHAGDGLVVVWQDEAIGGSMIRGRRVTLGGEVQGDAFDIAQSAVPESWPMGCAAAGGSALVWMDAGKSVLGLLGAGNGLTSTSDLDQGMYPAVAGAGEQGAVVWSLSDRIGFARPPAGGGAMTPAFHDGVMAKLPRVSFGGDTAYVAWEDTRSGGAGSEQIYLVGVSSSDAFTSEVIVPGEAGSANWPSLAWTGAHVAVAYYQFRDGPPSVYLSLLTSDLGRAGDDVLVSGDAPARFPSMASSGTQLGVAYAEKDGAVYLSLVTCP